MFVGIWFVIWGIVTIQAAVFPTKNSLTKAIYWMVTISPRMGSMTDETWVIVNGVGLLVFGVLVLGLWAFGVFN
jgi:hypothetical protein